jgi:inhibitor of cysteine peptidase
MFFRRGLPGLMVLAIAGCTRRTEVSTPAVQDTATTTSPAPAETATSRATAGELPLGLALKDDGRTVQLAPGQVVMVSLRANHTTGYRWVLADSARGVLAREGDPSYDADSSSGIGAGGFETWRFRAAHPGRGSIVLDYRRPWEDGKRPETTVRYVIDVR